MRRPGHFTRLSHWLGFDQIKFSVAPDIWGIQPDVRRYFRYLVEFSIYISGIRSDIEFNIRVLQHIQPDFWFMEYPARYRISGPKYLATGYEKGRISSQAVYPDQAYSLNIFSN
jgi:hypothetical protein